ncbi:MAG: hypothetical protein AAF787_11100 [Chloroflexota bacterium]
METRYFVKFIGDKHVTIAKAHNVAEAAVLIDNQYEETTEFFYNWVRQQTAQVA